MYTFQYGGGRGDPFNGPGGGAASGGGGSGLIM